MLVIAHRGASADYPEQTTAAIAAAWAQGADGVELDLRLTADRRLLLHHDPTLARCCGDPRAVARLDSRWRAGLNACHTRADLPPEPPLLLEEALELVPVDRLLVLELKEGPAQVAPLSRALGRRSRGLLLISFHRRTLREACRALPGLPALWLRAGDSPPAAGTRRRWLRSCRDEGLAGLDLPAARIDPDLACRLHADGLGLGAWTVDDAPQARHLRRLGVDWLTTNRPGEMRRALLE